MPVLSSLFEARGIYQLLDSVREPVIPESESILSEKAGDFLGIKTSEASEEEADKLKEEAREAMRAGKLDEFRKDKGVKERAGKLSPAHLAEFKAVIMELAEMAVTK